MLFPLPKCLLWGSSFACHMCSLVSCPVVHLGLTFSIPEAAGPLELAVTSVSSFGLLGTQMYHKTQEWGGAGLRVEGGRMLSLALPPGTFMGHFYSNI